MLQTLRKEKHTFWFILSKNIKKLTDRIIVRELKRYLTNVCTSALFSSLIVKMHDVFSLSCHVEKRTLDQSAV
jgi:hypothetical protein